MTISYTQIPASRMIPLFAAEFTTTAPETVGALMKPVVLQGQKLPAAPATVGTPYLLSSNGQAVSLFGAGSPLQRMIRAYLAANPGGSCYAIAQTDAGGATAASRTLTWTGTSTEAGTVKLYIGGQLVEIPVAVGDDGDAVAAAVTTAVTATAAAELPATCSTGTTPNEHVNTITAKVKGTVGNLISLAVNALGAAGGEELPAGLSVAVSGAMLASGATDPTSANWVSALGTDAYSLIGLQFDNSTVVGLLQTELGTRWAASSAKDGVLVVAKIDSKADLLTWGSDLNDEHVSSLGIPESSGWLSPAFELVGSYCGIVARACVGPEDPAASVQMTPMPGLWGRGTNFSDTDRDALANGGIATVLCDNGTCYLELEALSRRTTELGDPETRFQDIQVPLSMSYLRAYYKAKVQTAYPRHKLANDGTPIPGGSKVVTPSIVKAAMIAWYRSLAGVIVEDVEAFAAAIIVERNATNPNRLDGYIEPNFINRLRVFALQIAQKD